MVLRKIFSVSLHHLSKKCEIPGCFLWQAAVLVTVTMVVFSFLFFSEKIYFPLGTLQIPQLRKK
ncbi:hypothetical protein AUJ38_01300 [bacterium CG1_02_42_9]|nr:MAG: hypothetical protein AUJ38_01300 [bacterium CG1_02_42_9]